MDRGPEEYAPVVDPEVARQEMRERASSTEQYWQNYLSFKADAGTDRDNALQRIEQQERFGTLAPEQAQSAREAIEGDYQSRLEGIESGPTRELLNTEFQAQHKFAQQEYTDATEKYRIELADWEAKAAKPTATVELGPELGDHGPTTTVAGATWVPPVKNYGDLGDQPGYWKSPDQPWLSDLQTGSRLGKGRPVVSVTPTDIGERPAAPSDFEFAGNADDYFGSLFGAEGAPTSTRQGAQAPGALRRRAGDSVSESIGVGQIFSWY